MLDERSEANKAKFGGAATTGGFNTGTRASLGFEAAKKRGVKREKPAGEAPVPNLKPAAGLTCKKGSPAASLLFIASIDFIHLYRPLDSYKDPPDLRGNPHK